jgi:hypothetical protein
MFDPLPIISDDDPDSFVSLSEAARATFERLSGLMVEREAASNGSAASSDLPTPSTHPCDAKMDAASADIDHRPSARYRMCSHSSAMDEPTRADPSAPSRSVAIEDRS